MSFVQFMTSDGGDNIWFVEQQSNKIGTTEITEVPVTVLGVQPENQVRYSEVVSPMIAFGIILTSLFYTKSIRDKRRLNAMIHA